MEHDLYFISMAARLLDMHPQTLRKYERLGLVQPSRTIGSMRLYSRDELQRIKAIKRLVDDNGINLAGVRRLLSIAEVVRDLYRSEAQPEQSYSERQLYEAALDRMAREIAAVEKMDEASAVAKIDDVLAKTARHAKLAAEAESRTRAA